MPRVGISYSIQTINHNRIIAPKPEVTKSNEFSIAMAFGVKQIDYYSLDPQVNKKYKNRNYTVGNLVGLYQKRISLKSKIGTGIDITIDPSGNAKGFTHGDTNAVFPAPFNEQLKLAWILSYEMMIGKFSMVLQPGFYFYRTTHDPSPFFYQRAGLRYNLDNGLFIGTAIRAVNFGQADWIEWTIGYKLKR